MISTNQKACSVLFISEENLVNRPIRARVRSLKIPRSIFLSLTHLSIFKSRLVTFLLTSITHIILLFFLL